MSDAPSSPLDGAPAARVRVPNGGPLPRIMVVEDEPPARLRLRMLLQELAPRWPHQWVGEAAEVEAALDVARLQRPDIVLLDIQIPDARGLGRDGLAVARELMSWSVRPAIIFITAFDAHAVQAFDVDASDYLLKPVRTDRLQRALLRAAERCQLPTPATPPAVPSATSTQAPAAQLTVFERGKLLIVPIDSVIYFKAELKYVTIRTAERDYITETSLVAIENEFPDRFVRVHRNTLVAKWAIMGFERQAPDAENAPGEAYWAVIVRDVPERLPVSRRQWHALRSLVRTRRGS